MNARLLTYFIVALQIVAVGVVLFGLKDWAKPRTAASGGRTWRNWLTLGALICGLLALTSFASYSIHNAFIGGDRNGSEAALFWIRSGNYLSIGAIVLSIGGKGKGRWAALFVGCGMLFLWLGQGMSL
jgi:hypothetical protein